MELNTTRLKKVMIVDDAELDRLIAKKTIAKSGFAEEVIAAESAMEALEYLATTEEAPALIFLDINMPEMSGFDFLDAYQKLAVKNRCIIVMLSSSLHPEDYEKAESHPYVCKFLNKPLTRDKLTELEPCLA